MNKPRGRAERREAEASGVGRGGRPAQVRPGVRLRVQVSTATPFPPGNGGDKEPFWYRQLTPS